MNKVLIFFTLMSFVLSLAQNKSDKKFQFGISYSLTNEDEIFKNPFNGYVNYQIIKWNDLDWNAGLKVFSFVSKKSDNFTNKIGFNPNISTSYFFAKNRFNVNLAIGYYFDSYTFKTTSVIPPFQEVSSNIKTNGITIAPGLKYFFHPNIFIDVNTTFLVAKTKDNFYKDTTADNTFINLGLGVAF